MDLFLSKENELLGWCKGKSFFSKAQVMEWGLKNHYIRADRTIRDFVREGKIRRLNKDEQDFRGMKGKMSWYEFEKEN